MIKAIVFSNNSPKLLDVFLQSVKTNNIQAFNFSILYKSESNDSEYMEVFERNGISSFKKEESFKQDLLGLLIDGDEGLISFFKDTNYFFSEMPETDIEQIMSDQDIFCASLILGRNIKNDFNNNVENILIEDEFNYKNMIKWNWVKHYLSFGRPLELGGGHIFKKKDIYKLFKKWNYNNIFELESSFENLDYFPRESMISFKKSVLIDLIIESDCNNIQEEIKKIDFEKNCETTLKI